MLVAATAGCARPAPPERAFFYWRTVFALSAAERAVLAEQRVERLYVRFFDVARDDPASAPVPLARLVFREPVPVGVEVVPVVYLKNEVFASPLDVAELAAKVWGLVAATAAGGGVRVAELQLDCDWTDGTREAFFAFCRTLDEATDVELTATIRLHQVKYRQRTGVPPVERGTLMFYNVGRITADAGPSSIFNAADAGRYTAALAAYPLPLDVALPVFSWLVHGRAGRVVGLVEKTAAADLAASPFLRRVEDGRWQAVEAAYFRGTYLKAGDTLTLEAATPAVAREAAALLAAALPRGVARTVALFDLDERNLRAFAAADLEALFTLAP